MMTTFFGVVLGMLIGWLGGHFAGRIFGYWLHRMAWSYNPNDKVEIGSTLMILQTVVLGLLGGTLACVSGLTLAVVGCLVAAVVIPVVGFIAIQVSTAEYSDVPDIVYNSPIIVCDFVKEKVLQLVGFAKEKWNNRGQNAQPVTEGVGAGDTKAPVAIRVDAPTEQPAPAATRTGIEKATAEDVVPAPAPAVVAEQPAAPAVATEPPAAPAVATELPAAPAVATELPAAPAVATELPAALTAGTEPPAAGQPDSK